MAIVGGYGAMLLYRISGRIDQILRENYASVIYMEDLKEALERMDSSFQFALAGREVEARKQFEDNWRLYSQHLDGERSNITLPGEGELVARLTGLSQRYRERGKEFFENPDVERRQEGYFGKENQPGLLAIFKEMKDVSNGILRLNQDNMQQADREARKTAESSLLWFAICLSLVAILAVLLARRTINTIIRPIQNVTESVLAIGSGNLNQVVPAVSSDELGQLAGAVNTMARQLRDYRQSQQAHFLRVQQAAQATIDSFPDPVLVVDRDGLIEMVNPAATRILGLLPKEPSSPERVAWQPPEVLREPLAQALQHERAYLPGSFDQAVAVQGADEQRSLLPRILPIKDPYGSTLGAAVVLADVTRFQLLDQVKSDLVATASHELKTPLSSISMAIHVLLEETVGPLTPKQIELLVVARSGCERLLSMINNLLDLARLKEGVSRLDIGPEQPAALLRAAADLVRERAEDQEVELVVRASPDLPRVAVDALALGHALRNLLDNALSYTGRRGRVTLTAAAVDDAVVVTVADTGIGIPSEYVPHVFDRFFRIPQQSRGSGSGLGLAIVREIIVSHGGSIKCRSTPGEGTTFQFTLPLWRESTKEAPSPAAKEVSTA
jgi:signal transduction histidine kinase/HAMP domain-containing protein